MALIQFFIKIEGNWKFVEKLKSVSTTENSPATFEATVNEPNADVTWYCNGEEIKPDDDRFEIGLMSMKRSLTVKKPKKSDNGMVITCKTTMEKTEAKLSVKGAF